MVFVVELCIVVVLAVFIQLLLLWGYRSRFRSSDAASSGLPTVDGAVFALVGLLLAFTFSGSQSRLEHRRETVLHEANAISTAYSRVDLLPELQAQMVRKKFKVYIDKREAAKNSLPNIDLAETYWSQSHVFGSALWKSALAATEDSVEARRLLLPALNEMFDRGMDREVATRSHMPPIVAALLFVLTGLAALLAGRAMAGSSREMSRTHRWTLAIVFSLVLTTLLDLEYPRLGFIQVREADQAMDTAIQPILDFERKSEALSK